MSALFHPLRLPNGIIKNNLWLAPLAGYTDRAFRSIAESCGAGFTFTEMISAEAIARGNEKTFRLAERAPDEKQYGIQVFGADYRSILSAARALLSFAPFLIDLNCGCSVPKILKSGAGARLLLEPEKIGEIVRALHEEIPVPISVKLRSGWDDRSRNYLSTAEAAVRNGACLITLHPRTRAQGFTGQADWDEIKTLKSALPVPLIGSGDLLTPQDAMRMLVETGCDGVMFARGAIGNPFIFEATRTLLADGVSPQGKTVQERLDAAFTQLSYLCTYKSERIAVREMRKHFAHYVKGIPEAAAIRRAVNTASSVADYEKIIADFGGK